MRVRQILIPAAWLLTALAAFLAGWFGQDVYRFWTTLGKPHVRSDSSVRNIIRVHVGRVPESARELYYAKEGFGDTNEFTAMTIGPGDFNRWRKACFGSDLIETGSGTIPARVIGQGPDSWTPEFQDPNWDLSGCSKVSVYAKGQWVDVIWCKEQGRLFICDWGH